MHHFYYKVVCKLLYCCIALNLLQKTSAQSANNLLLKNYRPVSVFNIPVTKLTRAATTVIDMHSHDFVKSPAGLGQWVKTMDEKGVQKTIILSGMTGAKFDSIVKKYAPYSDRFDTWCGLDYAKYGTPDWATYTIAELERCARAGAKGVGELGDKGTGEEYSLSSRRSKHGPHFDDPQMIRVFKRCGELGMPVNIHIGEDAWMYLPADSTNDGLMNGAKYRIDMTKDKIWTYAQLFESINVALLHCPVTTFILCHYGNSCTDLDAIHKLLNQYTNLYVDISARFAEVAATPRATKKFFEAHQDRLLYGTDMGRESAMYEMTFRILESADEHFYYHDYLDYHWPLSGLDLPLSILEKVYFRNAQALFAPRDSKL